MTQSTDGSDRLEFALQEARQALGTSADVARLQKGLELKLAQGAASQLTAARSGGSVWPKWLLAAALAAGGSLYAVRQPAPQARSSEPPPRGSTASGVSFVPEVADASARAPVDVPSAHPPLDHASAPSAATSRAHANKPRRSQTARRPAPQVAELDPDLELTLIARAQQALRLQPVQALALLDEHAARFEHGILAQEREALRIDAERALGRESQARERARRFVSDFPRSPQARSLSRWLAQSIGADHKTPALDRLTP